jgi:hypothetical protein
MNTHKALPINKGGSLLDVLEESEISWNLFFKMSNQIINAVHTLHTWNPQILHRVIIGNALLLII